MIGNVKLSVFLNIFYIVKLVFTRKKIQLSSCGNSGLHNTGDKISTHDSVVVRIIVE